MTEEKKEEIAVIEITEEYKSMMDEILEKDEKGELNFISEEEFRNRCKKR